MKHAIEALFEARQRLQDHPPPGMPRGLAHLKSRELDRAISLLTAIESTGLPKHFQAVPLEAVDFGPFAEFRLLWDFECDDRSAWKEIWLRLSPGDVVITSEEQFAESKKRRDDDEE